MHETHSCAVAATPALALGRYRFRLEAETAVSLPDYAGSTWRGAFGGALRRLVCVTRQPACDGCALLDGCLYPNFFETPASGDAGDIQLQTAAPHPFVLTPVDDDPGQVAFTLFGRGNHALPYVVEAMRQAGRAGIGRGRVPMHLVEVVQEPVAGSGDWRVIWSGDGELRPLPASIPEIPPPPAHAVLRFETPLRLRHDGRNVTPASFRFADLFSALLRRISLLTRLHGEEPLQADFPALMARAREITLPRPSLHWHDWQRYSSRQQTKVPMGGLVGDIEIPHPDPAFWPCLWLGQYTQAGKGTSMGLGRYRVT